MPVLILLKLVRELKTNMCLGCQNKRTGAEHVNNKAKLRAEQSRPQSISHLLARVVCRPAPEVRPLLAPSNPL